MTELLLGLDLGTTNAKVAAYDLAGRAHAEAQIGYPTFFPRPGWAEQRPSDWTGALTTAIRRVVALLGAQVHDLVGAGLSSQGPGLVLVDDEGAPLVEASPTWQDERCSPQGRWLYRQVGTLSPGLGGPFTNFPAKLRWAQENLPEAAARARYAMGIKDYLVFWLTGVAATEPSTSSGGSEWQAATFAACDWSLGRLPTILGPADTVGLIRADRARDLGLPRPLRLVIGLNDGASATLATGAVASGEAIITLSTNGVLRVIMDAAVSADTRLQHNLFGWPYLPPDRWIAGGQTKSGASALQWIAQVIDGADAGAFDALLAQAQRSAVGSGGVIFLPYLMGRGSPRSDAAATGTFTGMTLATGRAELVRAVLEGTAFALRDIQDDFAQMGYSPSALKLSGGGGRSALWRQIIADVLGQPVSYYASDSTLGAAIVTAVGLGLHPDFRAAAQAMAGQSTRTEPIVDNVGRYHATYAAYRHARDALFPAYSNEAGGINALDNQGQA